MKSHMLLFIVLFLVYYRGINALPTEVVVSKELELLFGKEKENIKNAFEMRPYLSWYKYNHIPFSKTKARMRLTMQSAILNRKHKIVMCTVPKVACTQFRKFMLLLQTPELAPEFDKFDKGVNYTGVGKISMFNVHLNQSLTVPNVHNLISNPIHIMHKQTSNVRWQIYNSPEYLKVFHVRNPITRVLSAYLSKNNDSAYPMKFAKYNPTFSDFIHVSLRV